MELREGLQKLSVDSEIVRQRIFETLKQVNQDYREASKMIPAGSEPTLEIYEFGQGPFAVNDIRLKKHYIQTR